MEPECLLCGARGAPFHHEENGYRYLRCAACGLVFLHPRPSDEELHALYQQECGVTFHHVVETAEAVEKRLEARWRYRIVRPWIGGVPPTALEIGCGAGYFLELLRSAGWKVAGSEAAGAYVRFARERLGLDVRESLEDLPGPFGAVFLFNVLSHLPHPERELRAARERLADGGVVVIETGNAAEVPPACVGWFGAPDHLAHYGQDILRDLLWRCGFRDVRVRRFNVEWQRRLLAMNPRKGGGAGGGGAPAVPRRRPAWKRAARSLLSRVLLGVRYAGGRVLADRRHFCTLIVAARKR
ncbi:MAG: class I SAM-dependent methyltransferase [Planctomycetes bacterium]|nr:class I SAM-dependent methyltransferase [Planctomycetota bacterium]